MSKKWGKTVKLKRLEKDIRVGVICPHCGSTKTHGARAMESHPDGRWGHANAACTECDNGFSVDMNTGKTSTLDTNPERDRSQKAGRGIFGDPYNPRSDDSKLAASVRVMKDILISGRKVRNTASIHISRLLNAAYLEDTGDGFVVSTELGKQAATATKSVDKVSWIGWLGMVANILGIASGNALLVALGSGASVVDTLREMHRMGVPADDAAEKIEPKVKKLKSMIVVEQDGRFVIETGEGKIIDGPYDDLEAVREVYLLDPDGKVIREKADQGGWRVVKKDESPFDVPLDRRSLNENQAKKLWKKMRDSGVDCYFISDDELGLKKLKAMDQAKVIAVDLNRTLATGSGPDPQSWGEMTKDEDGFSAADAMRKLRDEGFTICINSVVGDDQAIDTWLNNQGIVHDYINESPAQPEGSSDKLNAVAYIDDRVIPYRGSWKETLEDLHSSGVLEKRIRIVDKGWQDWLAKVAAALGTGIQKLGGITGLLQRLFNSGKQPAQAAEEVGPSLSFLKPGRLADQTIRQLRTLGFSDAYIGRMSAQDAWDAIHSPRPGPYGRSLSKSVEKSWQTWVGATAAILGVSAAALLAMAVRRNERGNKVLVDLFEANVSPEQAAEKLKPYVLQDGIKISGRPELLSRMGYRDSMIQRKISKAINVGDTVKYAEAYLIGKPKLRGKEGTVVSEDRSTGYRSIHVKWNDGSEEDIPNASILVQVTKSAPHVKSLDKAQYLDEEGDNSIWIMTTGDVDRDGETVDPEGVDFSEFDINPVVLDNHNTDGGVTDVILGKVVRHWLDEVGEGTKWPQVGGERQPAQLCEIEWNESTQKGRDSRRMAKAGQLNGGSISFVPLVEPSKNSKDGNHYSKVKILEFTLCPVGSNFRAVRLKRLKKAIDYKVGDGVLITGGSYRGRTGTIKETGSEYTIELDDDKSGRVEVPRSDVSPLVGRVDHLRWKDAGTKVTIVGRPFRVADRDKDVRKGDTGTIMWADGKINAVQIDRTGDVVEFHEVSLNKRLSRRRKADKMTQKTLTASVTENGDYVVKDTQDDEYDGFAFPTRQEAQAFVNAFNRGDAKAREFWRTEGQSGRDWNKSHHRKCWINKSTKMARLLKSEGEELTPEEEETLVDMGVETADVEEKVPEGEEWEETELETKAAAFSVGDDVSITRGRMAGNPATVTAVTSSGYTVDVFDPDNSGGAPIRGVSVGKDEVGPSQFKSVDTAAEDVAEKAQELVAEGTEPEEAVDQAIVEEEVPVQMAKAVKTLVMKGWFSSTASGLKELDFDEWMKRIGALLKLAGTPQVQQLGTSAANKLASWFRSEVKPEQAARQIEDDEDTFAGLFGGNRRSPVTVTTGQNSRVQPMGQYRSLKSFANRDVYVERCGGGYCVMEDGEPVSDEYGTEEEAMTAMETDKTVARAVELEDKGVDEEDAIDAAMCEAESKGISKTFKAGDVVKIPAGASFDKPMSLEIISDEDMGHVEVRWRDDGSKETLSADHVRRMAQGKGLRKKVLAKKKNFTAWLGLVKMALNAAGSPLGRMALTALLSVAGSKLQQMFNAGAAPEEAAGSSFMWKLVNQMAGDVSQRSVKSYRAEEEDGHFYVWNTETDDAIWGMTEADSRRSGGPLEFNTYAEAQQAAAKLNAMGGRMPGIPNKSRRKGLDELTGPVGLCALKKLIKAMEEEMKVLHKSEQPHVIDAIEDALKRFKNTMRRAYKDAGEEDPDAIKKGMRFVCKGKRYVCKAVEDVPVGDEDNARVVESSEGENFVEDPVTEAYDGPYDTQEEAVKSVEEKAGGIRAEEQNAGQWVILDEDNNVVTELQFKTKPEAEQWIQQHPYGKSLSRKNKRLSKADTDVVSNAIEDLESMAGGSDLPKHLKGTVRKMAEDLKSLCNKSTIPDDPDAEMPDEVLESLEKGLSDLRAERKALGEVLFERTGNRILRN